MRKDTGITLIALVITIIVLLIIAGVSIATLTGEGGILTKANEAKVRTEKEQIMEEIKLEILELQTNKEGKVTENEVKSIIAKYDKNYDENTEFVFKTNEKGEEQIHTKNGYTILVKEIWELPREDKV